MKRNNAKSPFERSHSLQAWIKENLLPEERRVGNFVFIVAFAFFGLCSVFSAYLHLTGNVFAYDDSFITFRYVSNILEGHGLVYNVGQRVFGSTSPLYMVWLVFLKILFPFNEIPMLAIRGNVIFYLGSALGFLFLFQKLLGLWAPSAVAASLFLLRTDILRISMGGNETFLFCGFVLWAFYLLMNEHYVLSGMLAGLSIMTRPEGIFCALVVGLVWLLHNRKKPISFLAAIVAPGLIWTVFAFAYYGTPIYHCLIAKSRPIYPLPPGHAFHNLFLAMASWTPGAKVIDVSRAILFLALAGFIIRRTPDRKTWFVIPVFWALVLTFYGVSNPLLFSWYYSILFLGWYTLVIVGITYLLLEATERICRDHNLKVHRCLALAMSVAIPLLFLTDSGNMLWQQVRLNKLNIHFQDPLGGLSTIKYRDAAEFINRVGDVSDSIAAPEIGVLGYYSNHHIYDACGLVSPEAIPFLPVPHGRRVGPAVGSISAEFARAVDADWIVTTKIFAVESLAEDPWFRDNYSLVERFPLAAGKYVLVYSHKKKSGKPSATESTAACPSPAPINGSSYYVNPEAISIAPT